MLTGKLVRVSLQNVLQIYIVLEVLALLEVVTGINTLLELIQLESRELGMLVHGKLTNVGSANLISI
jgi:hypothetical protein